MTRHIALLRGINVGRAKRVAMADLRDLLGGLGYTQVRTLLNSGNVVFDAPAKRGDAHAKRIQEAIAQTLGVETHVIVKTQGEWAAIVDGNPLLKIATDHSRLLVAVTRDDARLAGLAGLAKSDWSPDALAVTKGAAYIWCTNGILESKLAQSVGRALGEFGTTRNWATVEKLRAIVEENAD